MEAFSIVDRLDELADPLLGLRQVRVFVEIDLLAIVAIHGGLMVGYGGEVAGSWTLSIRAELPRRPSERD